MANWHHLRPVPAQYREFRDHLCRAHSWYKHLPLLTGQRFVVFVAPDAGIGNLVVRLQGEPGNATGYTLVTPEEGPEFTEERPRLHHTWTTTQEYRQRFGYLDYMYHSEPGQPYARDAGPPVQLPSEIEERCSFVLYPYVSGQFIEAILWERHAEAIESLRAGASHPAREEVLELSRLAGLHRTAWCALTDQERECVSITRRTEEQQTESLSVDVRNYLDLDDRLVAAVTELHEQEAEKIRRALSELDRWLQAGG